MITTLALMLWLSVAPTETDLSRPPQNVLDHYYQEYPYMKYRGRLWSIESEFTWPEGFRRLDSASLSPFQYWVSHLPLWHQQTGVASLERGDVYRADQISRAVHLPWRTSRLTDYAIPLQVLAEYVLAHGLEDRWQVLPRGGDTITYDRHLANGVVFDAHGNLKFRPSEPRIADSLEFNKFFNIIATNSNYSSLAANADSVSESDLRPGDLLISRNDSGNRGRVYMILLVAQDDAGEKRYIVGTGCSDFGCDFHIPLFHADRTNPWLTLDELKALAPPDFARAGFYRLRVPQ